MVKHARPNVMPRRSGRVANGPESIACHMVADDATEMVARVWLSASTREDAGASSLRSSIPAYIDRTGLLRAIVARLSQPDRSWLTAGTTELLWKTHDAGVWLPRLTQAASNGSANKRLNITLVLCFVLSGRLLSRPNRFLEDPP